MGVGACGGVLLRVNYDSLVLGIHARVPERHSARQTHGPIASPVPYSTFILIQASYPNNGSRDPELTCVNKHCQWHGVAAAAAV